MLTDKTQDELDADAAAGLKRLRRWLPVILIGLAVAFAIWRWAHWAFFPICVLIVLAYFVRSPWGVAVRAWLLDRVFHRLFHVTHNQEVNQSLPFRPLGEFEPADGPRELEQLNWPAPARNDEHAWNRIEYARVSKLLEGMSRDAEGDGWHERRKLVLYHAQLLDALHQAGDDPLKTQAAPAMAAFAAPVAQGASLVRFLGRALSSAHLWIMGALAAFGGWQFARAEKLDIDAMKARQHAASWQSYAREMEGKANAAEGARIESAARAESERRESQKLLETARRRRATIERDIRRIEHEASRAVGADVAIGLRILTEPTDSGAEQVAADPPAADPGLQSGMPDGGGDAPGVSDAGTSSERSAGEG